VYAVQQPGSDVERPWWHDPDLDPDPLVLREEDEDPKDELLRWTGNRAERAAIVVMSVWFVVSDGWFGPSTGADIAGNVAGGFVVVGTCWAASAAIRRRRPELFEDESAAPAAGGW
jgi:hypothetical protein